MITHVIMLIAYGYVLYMLVTPQRFLTFTHLSKIESSLTLQLVFVSLMGDFILQLSRPPKLSSFPCLKFHIHLINKSCWLCPQCILHPTLSLLYHFDPGSACLSADLPASSFVSHRLFVS